MDSSNGHVMNLANSIIGVSVLAMPYCFKQCGIVLSIVMLIMSSIVSRLACHYLLKSAIMSRRRTFEFLAFHIFGSIGKLSVEVGMIGFLLGTCIAFFVVMGDLGPEIIAEITDTYITDTMRTSILMALALFVILPLGLLRNVSSLNDVSRATIGFYCCLVLKVVFEAIPHLYKGDWFKKVNFWRTEGILQCLPIFSMALFCQTQLFEIYQTVQNATLEKMNKLICVAVNICTSVYIFVGVFGYIAFADKPFTGNILLSFSPSFITDVMKIGFIISVAFSFPLVIFPCRASLYSLLYKEGYSLHEGVSNYITETRFKSLTILIVLISLIIGIMIPNIEFVLGLVGSTIGVMICVIFPVTCFISLSPKSTNERLLAQLMLMIGIFVMILGTYKNLSTVNNSESNVITFKPVSHAKSGLSNVEAAIEKLPTTVKLESRSDNPIMLVTDNNNVKDIRHEPPQPIEPIEENVKDVLNEKNKFAPHVVKLDSPVAIQKKQNESKNEEVDIEAIKKEDKEEQLQRKDSEKNDDHQILIDTIQKQNEVQKEIVEQQKKLIEVIQNQRIKNENKHDIVKEEKLKAVKEIESIALKAIEKISEGEDSKTVMKEMEKNIQENELKNSPILKDPEENLHKKSPNAGTLESRSMQGIESVQKKKEVELESPIDNDMNRKISLPEHKELILGKAELKTITGQPQARIGEKTDDQVTIDGAGKIEAAEGNKNNEISDQLAVKSALHSNEIQSTNIKVNNTAPLFLSLGKAQEKLQVVNPQQMLPLPVAVANINKVSNDSRKDDGNSLLKDTQPHGNEV